MGPRPFCGCLALLLAACAPGPIPAPERAAPAPPTVTGAASPVDAVRGYVRGLYARDYAAAYRFLTSADQRLKSEAEYVEENLGFAGFPLELSRRLADLIRFRERKVEVQGDRATVTVHLTLPDASAPLLQKLLDEAERPDLTAEGKARLLRQVAALERSGQFPVVIGEESFSLLNEGERWGVFLNFAEAVVVRLEGAVMEGLPFTFTPARPLMRVKPGETVQTTFRVKNVGKGTVTGKARHLILPGDATAFVTVVQCFCFLHQTLAPGEELSLPVIFRVEFDAPEPLRALTLRYEFYPLERFRPEWEPKG
ncbi:MAG TPA: cytochrome c oxidase assembly protein [Candidatus Methylomirabilis sp.]|nr:cytochrome c oxidase assembly protein [Candidatus Methylomirabilis sp.]